MVLVPREEERRRPEPRCSTCAVGYGARLRHVTFTAVTGSIIFNFTTNGNGELLANRAKSIARDPAMLATMLFIIFSLASLAQLVVGKLIDRSIR